MCVYVCVCVCLNYAKYANANKYSLQFKMVGDDRHPQSAPEISGGFRGPGRPPSPKLCLRAHSWSLAVVFQSFRY